MNDTQNYHLPQFAESDRIHHDDFNDAFAKIDTAVKTNSTAITALDSAKASAAALTAETTARQNADSAEATARTNADTALQNAINAEAAARAAADAALQTAIGSGGKTCRIATGSYVGTGTYGSSKPNSLTFDFHPMVVFIADEGTASNGPAILSRGPNLSHSGEYPYYVTCSWRESGVSWYTTSNTSSSAAAAQCNQSGSTYYYVALGYDE